MGAAVVALGLVLPLALRNNKGSDQDQTDSPFGTLDAELFQFLPFLEYYQFDVKRYRQVDAHGNINYTTIGTQVKFECDPLDCLESDEHCLVRDSDGNSMLYEPGCCAGPDCPLDEKCGDLCIIGVHCNKTREDCLSRSCYECQKGPKGEDLHFFRQAEVSIDCLEVGTKVSEDGIEYNWAIACGPQESGGSEEENRADGEYQVSI